MENTIVPKAQMLSDKDLKFSPTVWSRLNTNTWIHDYGLQKALNRDRPGMGDYYKKDKGGKNLWDLYLNMDDSGQRVVRSHYDFPADLYQFIRWAYNFVATDYEWKEKYESRDQMNYFPYQWLYKVHFQKISGSGLLADAGI